MRRDGGGMSDAQRAITEWLTMLRDCCLGNGLPEGYHYAGIGDFLLQHGVWYEPQPLPKRIRRGVPRGCFANAMILSKTRGYSYVEGYAVPALDDVQFPVHHAWNLDKDGNLIDNTWEKTGLAYFGVEFPYTMAAKAIKDSNTVLDNPHARFEIFREPYVQVRSCAV